MEAGENLTCPFCGYDGESTYRMLLHIEIQHNEDGDSPFAVKDALTASERVHQDIEHTSNPIASSEEGTTIRYVDCPYQCGERLPEAELEFHQDFHLAEGMALEDAIEPHTTATAPSNQSSQDHQLVSDNFSTSLAGSLRNYDSKSRDKARRHGRQPLSLKELFFGTAPRKRPVPRSVKDEKGGMGSLGKAELGPYAYEKRMPSWLLKLLEEGSKPVVTNTIGPCGDLVRITTVANETPALVPVLARLSALDPKVLRAFYCSPDVHHVAKLKGEGGFCGYRNIQMLVSYIRDAKAPGYKHFRGALPSILRLQDLIEDAWDMGFDSASKIETGGIRGTRKYIGTPEAQAMLQSLGIPCEAALYTATDQTEAFANLMQAVFEYFDSDDLEVMKVADLYDVDDKVVVTHKPPLYLQRRGHSMTIVGVEVHDNGSASLIVFDPMFHPSPTLKKLVHGRPFRSVQPAKLIKAHRRGVSYLSKFNEFELLTITGPPRN